jgi:hypothetical protein
LKYLTIFQTQIVPSTEPDIMLGVCMSSVAKPMHEIKDVCSEKPPSCSPVFAESTIIADLHKKPVTNKE